MSQDPIGLQGGNPTLYGYVRDVNGELDEFGLACNKPGGYVDGDVDLHGNLSPNVNRARGNTNTKADSLIQSHHPIQDAWAKRRINGYSRNRAPATLLPSASGMSHANISAAQRMRRRQPGGWTTTLRDEFSIGYKEMIDSGVSPDQARKAFKDSYKYFDSLRGANQGNPFYNI